MAFGLQKGQKLVELAVATAPQLFGPAVKALFVGL
jgi:hypothetical protein